MPSFSGAKSKPGLLAACFILVSSSTLKIEAVRSSEMSVNFYRTARHYIPEGRTLRDLLFFVR
jgi:hypothetical protein